MQRRSTLNRANLQGGVTVNPIRIPRLADNLLGGHLKARRTVGKIFKSSGQLNKSLVTLDHIKY